MDAYSALFTSGLLSGHNSPSTSRAPSVKRRRGKKTVDSLPCTVNTVSFHAAVRSDLDASDAMFLTLVPHRYSEDEDRSFLSLDLAESQSMRSMSLRRKDTVASRETASVTFGRSESGSPPSGGHTHHHAFSFSSFPPPKSPAMRLRKSSRESLIPSPKPVPSSSLPDLPPPVPRAPQSRRPSNLTLTLSTILSSAPPNLTYPCSPMHRASQSAPSLLSPTSPARQSSFFFPRDSPEQSYLLFSPTSPTEPLSPPCRSPSARERFPHASAPPSVPLRSLSFRSVASLNTRLRNRSAALAVLEGRSDHAATRTGNFMCMSDEEEDELDEHERQSAEQSAGCANVQLLQVLQEEEDVVIPVSPTSTEPRTPVAHTAPTHEAAHSPAESTPRSSSTPPKMSRRGTLESLFSPLANFIDFREDDRSTRNWRSFVEISS